MHLNDHSNEKPYTRRNAMLRKLVCVTMVALVATLLVLPVQADEVWLPCSDCDKTANMTTMPTLPQGETEEIQPSYGEEAWDADSDDPYGSMLDAIMCLAYFSPDCLVYLHQKIWIA